LGSRCPTLVHHRATCARRSPTTTTIHAAILTGFLSELVSIDLARPWVMWRLRCAALRGGTPVSSGTRWKPDASDEDFHSSVPNPSVGTRGLRARCASWAEGAITGEAGRADRRHRLEPEYTLTQAPPTGASTTTPSRTSASAPSSGLVAWLSEQARTTTRATAANANVEIRAVNAVTITAAPARPRTPPHPSPTKSRT